MSDRDAYRLMELLASYAAAYGLDADADLTVKQLADDLAEANERPEWTAAMEDMRDAIYDGMNRDRKAVCDCGPGDCGHNLVSS